MNDDQEFIIRFLHKIKPELFKDTLLKWITSNSNLDNVQITQNELNRKYVNLLNVSFQIILKH